MGMLGTAVVIASIVATAGSAHADSNGFGFVPGARIGAVRGSFDGTAEMPEAQSGWGYTHEFHVDVLRTFDRDRRALGLSVGWMTQTHGSFSEDDVAVPSGADAFKHVGPGFSLMLTTMIKGRNSLTARAGWVAGKTETGAGPIDATLKRYGLELTRIFASAVTLFAGQIAIEYFTFADETRRYVALAVVLGGTFVFHD
jgi:hypothetical protein